MALTNQERVGKAIEQLRAGLRPFVERELAAVHGPNWAQVADLGQRTVPGRAPILLVLADAVKPRLRSAILGEAVRASRL